MKCEEVYKQINVPMIPGSLVQNAIMYMCTQGEPSLHGVFYHMTQCSVCMIHSLLPPFSR